MDADELHARNGIGERLKAERQRLSLTQEELADKVGISRSTAFNYENGSRVPDALVLQRMSQLAGVDATFVVLGQRAHLSQLPTESQQLLDRYALVPQRMKDVIDSVALLAAMAFSGREHYATEVTYSVPAPPPPHTTLHEPAGKSKRRS